MGACIVIIGDTTSVNKRNDIVGAVILLLAFLLVSFSTVRHTGSDPRGSLLVTESILTHRTIKLDHYGKEILQPYGYTIHQKNGHYYYYFPLGTSIASIPFVALANGWGFKMLHSELAVQIGIATVTAILTLVFFIKLARIFLSPLNAVAISGVFWFGSSLASTTGTALWSHNFATLFALIAIYSSVKAAKEGKSQYWPLIALFLFSAYLSRPTMALLAPCVLWFFFTYHKMAACKSAVFLGLLLACFVGFSLHEFNQFLPDYYMPKRLTGEHFTEALVGNLISPARGLLIYSPFILLAWLCYPNSSPQFTLKPSWFVVGIVWPVLHLIMISRFPHWWAGHSFGARLMTDVLPGLFLLTIRTWPVVRTSARNPIGLTILAAASVFAVYVNSYQGMFNQYTGLWNAEPNIEKHPEYLWDWKYPQFLHNHERHEAKLSQYDLTQLPSISAGKVFLHTSDKVLFLGWWGAEGTHRWSSGTSAKIIFIVDNQEKPKFKGSLLMSAGSLDRQRLSIYLNDQQIYHGELNAWDNAVQIDFPPALLQVGKNSIRFDLPDARQPHSRDPRVLALALKSFSLY